jgi:hypothetical protein
MSSAKEFREFAKECVDWARTAKSEEERNIFLQMAQTWIEAAGRLENPPVKGMAGRSKTLPVKDIPKPFSPRSKPV